MMLNVQYAGPKPSISQHGIFFKGGKEDKYIYLKMAIFFLLSIDKEHGKKYHGGAYENIHDTDIPTILQGYEPELEKHIAEEEIRYEKHIDEMIAQVKAHPLSDADRSAWINNIILMKPYKIQREINKLYYIHCIKAIKAIIHRDMIKEIDVEFSLRSWHILESIAGNLGYGVKSVRTAIKVVLNKEGILIARLLINPPVEIQSDPHT